MQDIISTLKNALQQAEAGLEVAVGRLAKDGTERGDFKPSEVLALACVREALATPVTCLHQIQEPAAAEQAAWHAGLDEGRAQATGSVSNATSQAAPAAVAVPQDLRAAAQAALDWLEEDGLNLTHNVRENLRAALAATPAAPAAAAPVVLPEPDAPIKEVMTLVELHRQEIIKVMDEEGSLVDVQSAQDAIESKLRALLATAPLQPVEVPTKDQATWCSYIAGMIGCYLKEPDDSPRVKAIEGIIARRLWALPSAATATGLPAQAFQLRVQPWMMACFGPEISADSRERNHRFLEEALELVQSCGCTASEAHQLVDYVYGRPWGEPAQEAGGVMVTLAALCLANGLDMHACGETELARIWTKVEAIRAKQAAKPKHSPLPMHVPEVQAEAEDAESDYQRGYRHGYNRRDAEVQGALL